MTQSREENSPSTTPPSNASEALRRGLEAVRGAAPGLGGERLLELLVAVALLGGALLVVADFSTLFQIKSRGITIKETTGGDNHAYAIAVIGAVIVASTLLARASEAWYPAAAAAFLAVIGIGIALIGDLPDATRSDLLPNGSIGHASPALGFWLELGGGLLSLAATTLLALRLRAVSRAGER
jgi:hypothetical protein